MRVLNVMVGAPVADNLERARATMKLLQAKGKATPYYGVSFESLAQMLAVFTPKRLELIAALREQGPMSVAALARSLARDYKNVHGDVAALIEWLAVERDEDGLVYVPWDEIDFKLPLTRHAA
jgi:predicted transcriptional regulator